jgi:glycine/D-amino acid oxidase-like deaminating enzyme
MSRNASHKKIVIIGGSFGGVNAAYELRRKLRDQVEITVISRDPEFTFLPISSWLLRSITWRGFATTGHPCTLDGSGFLRRVVRSLGK